jgi:uncharacterized protein
MGTFFLEGPTGQLECLYGKPKEGLTVKGVLIMLPPHPQKGGTNQNKVVQTVLKAASSKNYFTYAPNFRGVGRSEGQYDHGQGERADVLALIEVVKNRHSNLPLILAGFSFGAYIALHVAQSQLCSHLILLSLAVGIYKIPAPLIPAGVATLLIHGGEDEVIPLEKVLSWAKEQNTPLIVLPAATHFLHRQLMVLQRLIKQFLP